MRLRHRRPATTVPCRRYVRHREPNGTPSGGTASVRILPGPDRVRIRSGPKPGVVVPHVREARSSQSGRGGRENVRRSFRSSRGTVLASGDLRTVDRGVPERRRRDYRRFRPHVPGRVPHESEVVGRAILEHNGRRAQILGAARPAQAHVGELRIPHLQVVREHYDARRKSAIAGDRTERKNNAVSRVFHERSDSGRCTR